MTTTTMYHGTGHAFNSFSFDTLGNCAWLTPSIDKAVDFAEQSGNHDEDATPMVMVIEIDDSQIADASDLHGLDDCHEWETIANAAGFAGIRLNDEEVVIFDNAIYEIVDCNVL